MRSPRSGRQTGRKILIAPCQLPAEEFPPRSGARGGLAIPGVGLLSANRPGCVRRPRPGAPHAPQGGDRASTPGQHLGLLAGFNVNLHLHARHARKRHESIGSDWPPKRYWFVSLTCIALRLESWAAARRDEVRFPAPTSAGAHLDGFAIVPTVLSCYAPGCSTLPPLSRPKCFDDEGAAADTIPTPSSPGTVVTTLMQEKPVLAR